MGVFEIRETEGYARWFRRLRDRQAKVRILVRIQRLSLGNPGDVAPVGRGVSEMRIHYGAGYRMYFTRIGDVVYLLLCGGTKRGQSRDIARAKQLVQVLKEI